MAGKTKTFLLSKKEEQICVAVSAGAEGIAKKRALALLELHKGSTRIKAAEASALTIGQVHYLVILFKKKGMSIFPETSSVQAEKLKSVDKPEKSKDKKKKGKKKKGKDKKKEDKKKKKKKKEKKKEKSGKDKKSKKKKRKNHK